MITQECLIKYKTILGCKLSSLATLYNDKVIIGDKCAEKLRCNLITANYLLAILCNTPDICWEEEEQCKIIEEIENIYNKWSLG